MSSIKFVVVAVDGEEQSPSVEIFPSVGLTVVEDTALRTDVTYRGVVYKVVGSKASIDNALRIANASSVSKNSEHGYPEFFGFMLRLMNAAGGTELKGTIPGFLYHLATAQRQWLLQDKDGALAHLDDITELITDAVNALPVTWNTLMQASGYVTALDAAGQYFLMSGEHCLADGGGSSTPVPVIGFITGQIPVLPSGASRKLRLRVVLGMNAVAPGSDFQVDMRSVSRPGSGGGMGLLTYEAGAMVASSSVVFETSGGQGTTASNFSESFDAPDSGMYALVVTSSDTLALLSHVHIQAQLELQSL